MKSFKAVVLFLDNFNKEHRRTILIKGENAKHTYNNLKNENGVYDILEFNEVTK